jgi:NAD(P)-dependent dehydrogenase (short-subunit alcohol dehydrogenase family)
VTEPRRAIVTGAASGIGRATAERLLRDGWRVVGVDLLETMPATVIRIVGDAAEPNVLARALLVNDGTLDGLVCAAGLPPIGPLDDTAHWDEILRVDLSGPYHALRACLPALAAARGSAVVVGSIVGSVEGSIRSPAYAAAKAGLGGLVRSMALVGAKDGVRVNLVEAGAIDTGFDPPLFPADARPDVPLGRMGTANEVAGAIAFLLSADATYITGVVLRVDGGRTIAGPTKAAGSG